MLASKGKASRHPFSLAVIPFLMGWNNLEKQREYNRTYKRPPQPPCSIDGCESESYCRGWCRLHYQRWYQDGDPLHVRVRPPANPKPYVPRERRQSTKNAYVSVSRPDHPNANVAGMIPQHRLVMSEMIGRPLLPGETVHHRNGNRRDNRPENLELWVSWQPPGQRVEDVLAWAQEVVARYAGQRNE